MRTLYFECSMGAAGDMLMAALLELHENPKDFLARLNAVGIPGVVVSARDAVKHGITGTHVSVMINRQEEHPGMYEHNHEHEHNSEHGHGHERRHRHWGEHNQSNGHEHDHSNDHEHVCSHEHGRRNAHSHSHEHNHDHNRDKAQRGHVHNSYHDIEHLIGHLKLSETVKNNVLAVYKLIAEAESHAHGVTVAQIHFHEVGEMDAVADIVGFCMLLDELAPEQILASPINVGSGQVRCAHGILPVPAPATVHVLQNVPIYSDEIRGELCTPTGAALLKHFVKKFIQMPLICVQKTGYGMGTKDFARANCVRAYLGDVKENLLKEKSLVYDGNEVVELICNLDDMTSEAVAFAQEQLLAAGALDVYITPIVMKKNRAGFQFTCMCQPEEMKKMATLIFKYTTTLGIRQVVSKRYTLAREQIQVQTKFGMINVKRAHGFGVEKCKPEYDDMVRIAREQGMTLEEVGEELT